MSSLLEKIEKAYDYCIFTREENVRKQLLGKLNESLESLTKNLHRYCFLKVVSGETLLSDLKNDVIIQRAVELRKNLEEILGSDKKFREMGEMYKKSIDALKEDIEGLIIGRFVTTVTNKLSQWKSNLEEKKKVLNNEIIAKVLDVNRETITHAENLLDDLQNKMKSDVSLDDIIWASSKVPELNKIMSSILPRSTIEIFCEKLGLTEDEAKKVNLLVSGEKVPLVEINDSLLRKIKNIFGDMAKITITS